MSPAAASPFASPANALPPGARLGEFEVLGVLGAGGFGIVYRALDHALEREVAIKEYMPAMLAGRTETMHVSLRSKSDAEIFAVGLRSFVNEAKLLARFDHPALLKVYRFWEQNGTAYMAMPIYHGPTLKAVRQTAGTPDEAWLRAMLAPLLGAIETLHAAGVYHRDIAPDNILIEAGNRPVLLDFGAARRVLGDRSQTLTAILKPAYAPIEQYAEASSARQGPWTDLYALGATLHYVLTGAAPPPATARTLHDDLVPLVQRALPGFSPALLGAVDWMLVTRPADRPQSVQVLREVLDGRAEPPPVRAVVVAPERSTTVLDVSAPWPTPAVAPAAALPRRPTVTAPGAASTAAAASAPSGWGGDSGVRRGVALVVGLLALAAGAAWWLWRPVSASNPVLAAQPAASVPVIVTAIVPAIVPASAAVLPPAAAPAMHEVPARVAEPAREAVLEPARPVPTPVRPATVRHDPPPARDSVVTPTPSLVPADAQPVLPATSSPLANSPAQIISRTPVPTAAALSDDASAICGSRVLLALFWCMERKCASADFKDHPACRKWFASNRQRPSP